MKKKKAIGLLLAIVLIGFGALGFAAYLGDWLPTGISANKIVESAEAANLRKQLGDRKVSEVALTGTVKIGGPIVVSGKKTITGDGQLMMDDAYQQDNESGNYLLILEKNAKVTVGGDVVLDGNSAVGCIQVKKGADLTVRDNAILRNAAVETANVWAEGDLTIAGGDLASAIGHNVWSAGKITLSGGTITGSGVDYAGIHVSGAMTQTGGAINEAGTNVYVAKGGSFTYEKGSNSYAVKDGIYVEKNAKLKLTTAEAKVRESGHNGITLEGRGIIDDALLYMSGNQQIDVGLDGYLEIKGGDVAYGLGNGIRNRGTVIMTGGAIYGTTNHGVVNSGTMEIKAGEIRDNGRNGIQNKNGGDIKVVGKDIALYNNAYGITNEENADCELAYAQVYNHSSNNIRDFGDIYIHDITLKDSYGNCINVAYGGTVKVKDTVIDGTSKNHGIYNTGDSVVELESVTIKNTSSRGIQNKDGKVIGKNVTIENTGGAGLGLVVNAANDKSGSVDIDGLTIRNGAGNHIYLEGTNPGTAVIKNATLHAAKGNNIKVQAGSLSLIDSKVLGNVQNAPNNVHGLLVEGGKVNLEGVTISNTAGKGIQNKGGAVTAENLTLKDLGTDGIGNKINDDKVTVGSVTVEGLTVKNSKRYTLINECAGTMDITDGTLGDTEANNVVLKSGTMNLTNVIIEGAHRPTGSDAGCHGIYAVKKESVLNIKDSIIKNVKSDRAIQVRGASVNIDGLTVSNIHGVVIGNDENQEYGGNGTINISGLISDKTCMSHIVSNETKGKIAIDDSYITGGSDKKSLIFNGVGGTIATGKDVELTGSKRQAINNQGIMTINGGTIHDNGKGSTVSGTAIFNSGTLTVDRCSIYDNVTADEKTGVINNAKEGEHVGHLTIKNSSIYDNTSGNVGGAIRTGDNTTLIVTGTKFYRNESPLEGGAIFAEQNAKVTLKDCTFSKNVAPSGGALGFDMLDSTIENTITNCVFTDNEATEKHGGAIYLHSQSFVTISGGRFNKNEAANGGAIRTGNDAVLNINGVLINENNATIGGGISAVDQSKIVLTNATFKSNKAETEGGAVLVESGSKTSMTGCTFNKNESASGGAVGFKNKLEGFENTITNCVFTENGATKKHGGAIYVHDGTTVTISGGSMEKNEAENGGAIRAGSENTVVNVNNVNFIENEASNEGGAISTADPSKVVLTNSTFEGNKCNKGSDINIGKNGTIDITDQISAIEGLRLGGDNSKANLKGQVVIDLVEIAHKKGLITVEGQLAAGSSVAVKPIEWTAGAVIFEADSKENRDANLIYFSAQKTNPDDRDFELGASQSNEKQAVLDEYVAKIGEAKYQTLALAVEYANAHSTADNPVEIEILDNIEVTSQINITGNVTIQDDGTVRTIERSKDWDSTDGNIIFDVKEGGKLSLTSTAQNADEVKLIVSGNKDDFEDGLKDGWLLRVGTEENPLAEAYVGKGVELTGNVSTTNGGATYIWGTLKMDGARMTNNKTTGEGGAIFAKEGSKVALQGCTFQGNIAKHGGAVGLSIGASEFENTITDCVFKENTATEKHGGAVYVHGGTTVTISGGSMENNKANTDGTSGNGGAIRAGNDNTVVKVDTVTFKGNKASNEGGAISTADKSKVVLSNSTFEGNTCTKGSDINIGKNGTIDITDSTSAIEGLRLGGDNSKANLSGKIVINLVEIVKETGRISVKGQLTQGSNIAVKPAAWKLGTVIYEAESKADRDANLSYFSAPKTNSFDDYLVIGADPASEVQAVLVEQVFDFEKSDYVAQIGNTKYETLAAAVEVANANSTAETPVEIQVIADTEVTSQINITGNVTMKDDGTARIIARSVDWDGTNGNILFNVKEGGKLSITSTSQNNDEVKLIISGNKGHFTDGLTDGWLLRVGTKKNSDAQASIGKGVELTGNVNKSNGGAVYVWGILNTTGGSLTHNTTTGHGGAVYLKGTTNSHLSESTFYGNQAVEGGALNLANQDGCSFKIKVEKCTFTSNEASNYGGAVAVSVTGDVTFDGCTFKSNIAKNSSGGGDAINLGKNRTAKIKDCTMTGNGQSDIRLGNTGAYITMSGKNVIERVLYTKNDNYILVEGTLKDESSIGLVPVNGITTMIQCDEGKAKGNLGFFNLVGDDWITYQLKVDNSNLVLSKKEEQ